MSSQTSLTQSISTLVNSLKKAKANATTLELAKLVWQNVSPDDLDPFSGDEHVSLTTGISDHLSQRRPGRAKVMIYNPDGDDSQSGQITVIEIVNDDMPFLFDSIVSLIADQSHTISLLAHPILAVKRAHDGKLLKLSPRASQEEGYINESLMHIHIERIEGKPVRQALCDEIIETLADIRSAVLDWQTMKTRIAAAIADYQQNPPPVPVEELTESTAFLQWLLDDHFTILGVREYAFIGGSQHGAHCAVDGTGLGVLRDPERKVLSQNSTSEAITPKIRAFLRQPTPLIITKSDCISRVHRRTAMDYVGIKLFDDDGELSGEIRIVGLFTSTAYTSSPRYIPLIRRKINSVIAASGLDLQSHSGKGMLNVLETFPRDELFQMEVKKLAEMANGIMALEERPRTRLFVSRDRFDRFVAAFAFIPRERFNSKIRQRIGVHLAAAFNGRVVSFSPFFSDAPLVRVHFIISLNPGTTRRPEPEALEKIIIDEARTWSDRLGDVISQRFKPKKAAALKRRFLEAFSVGYEEAFSPSSSIYDIAEIEELDESGRIGVHFFDILREAKDRCRLKLYHYSQPVSLSARLPILENMGLRASEESTFTVSPKMGRGSRVVFMHEVTLASDDGAEIDMEILADKLEEAFLAVWENRAENDLFNGLVLKAQFDWRDAALLRACAKYLRQIGIAYSTGYMARTLAKHRDIAAMLRDVFYARFELDYSGDRQGKVEALSQSIIEKLDNVPSLDEDQIIRRFLNLICAISRTNYFQTGVDGELPPTISFKIASAEIEDMPAPRPFAEIFVYSPDVEGIHLRGGKIARGGLRWSDRPQDFRTEVLGLAKAQNVKNAVIVPVGAKGGFVPKKLPAGGTREEIFAEGTRTYKLFVSALLEITDNLQGEKVIPPKMVVRNDGDDPYLVVAADKGTATFSDTANEISQSKNFWLDDAFASGGSAGYDHKKMGITARGGWEAVKRHFREMDIDIQKAPFTVIGVGDMSGDVFGNGMLLSKQIRLLAAFDHRDIFIDPDPDPTSSHKERSRLFKKDRSSWQDYNEKLISTGGGVFSRQLKAVPLSKEMRQQFGLSGKAATPNQLMQAIMKTSADLLWFGGIGTYVRASNENNLDVGDRANDGIRICASELAVKVIGEGANLGITQKGRIEFALKGGRINTDAIDNSAGVNSSDVEVNFKIGLGAAEKAGKLKRAARDKLLASMTDDVAELVLRNNYLQTLSLSMCQARSASEFGYTKRLMETMESQGLLDRKLEDLPDGTVLSDREATGTGFTRPELSVLIAYAKIALFDELIETDVPDDPYFESQLFRYFPEKMSKKFSDEIKGHKLRRELIVTLLANSVINRGGPTFIYRLIEETGHNAGDISRSFVLAREAFGLTAVNDMVDGLDAKISGQVQIGLYVELQRVLRRATVWFLLNGDFSISLEEAVAHYQKGLGEFDKQLETFLPEAARVEMAVRFDGFVEQGVPRDAARIFSRLRFMQRGPDVVLIASKTGQRVGSVAAAFFETGAGLGIDRLFAQSAQIVSRQYYDRLAVNRSLDGIVQTHRAIVMEIMSCKDKKCRNWTSWSSNNQQAVTRIQTMMDELLKGQDFTLARLTVAASQLNDLVTA